MVINNTRAVEVKIQAVSPESNSSANTGSATSAKSHNIANLGIKLFIIIRFHNSAQARERSKISVPIQYLAHNKWRNKFSR